MHDMNALKAEMVRNGYTQKTLAEAIGITPRTFATRIKTEDFGSKEISNMIKLLNLKKPWEIFFTN